MTDADRAEEVLLGEIEVKLTTGKIVQIRPWGIRTGRRMMARLKAILALMTVASQGNAGLGQLIDTSYDEIVGICADTLGIPVEEFYSDDYQLEDLLHVATAIIKLNFTEPATLGKALNEFLEEVGQMIQTEETEPATDTAVSPEPLSSS